jgi:hypothetical protein
MISEEKIYFRFQGELSDKSIVAPVNIYILKSHLEAEHDSLLSQLAGERWNGDATVGRDETNSIAASLSDCSKEWSIAWIR